MQDGSIVLTSLQACGNVTISIGVRQEGEETDFLGIAGSPINE
jgi:hypothetical protein